MEVIKIDIVGILIIEPKVFGDYSKVGIKDLNICLETQLL